ncbi:MAG: nuclear transport factor 2 family protein [Bacteroidota bacterium]
MKPLYLIMVFYFLNFFGIAHAQVAPTSELYRTFQKMDSIVFDAGFNSCDLAALEALLTDDLEFYHDQGGIQDKKAFLKAMKDNICSSPDRKPIRKLTPNTMNVFPMYNNGELYGALVEGKHEFYIKEPGKELYQTSTALFSGLWILKGDQWKMKRVFSYHHQ